jgi:hypothetical protein
VAKEKKPVRDSQPLLSLAMAARLIYARATGRSTDDPDTLNDLARRIAERTRIFTVNADETAKVLPAELVANGHFEEGGARLRLADPKRQPIGALAIRNVDLGTVMDEIQKDYGRTGGG